MKNLFLLFGLLFLAASASAQIRVFQLETIPIGKVISNQGTFNEFIDLSAENLKVTPQAGYPATTQAALNSAFATNIASLQAGGADGNNFTSGVAFTGTSTKTLTVSRTGLTDLTATFDDAVDDDDSNPTNESQSLSVVGTTDATITLSPAGGVGGGSVVFEGSDIVIETSGNRVLFSAPPANPTVNTANFTGTTTKTLTLTQSQGGFPITASFIDDVNDADASPTNELNVASVAENTNTVSLTNGGGTFSRVTDYHAGSTVIAASAQSVPIPATPATLADLEIFRNGIRYSASFTAGGAYFWVDGPAIKPGTGTPAFTNDEIITFKFPK